MRNVDGVAQHRRAQVAPMAEVLGLGRQQGLTNTSAHLDPAPPRPPPETSPELIIKLPRTASQ